MRGSASQGERFCGAPRPAPRHEGDRYMWGAAPHPDRGEYICGVSPRAPTRGLFSPKVPETRKKPNCIGFRLSSIDSEQGCRRQPCYFVWKSISNFFVSLPNVSEKDVKGLLFCKQQGTDVDFWLYEIDKAIQTLSSACRT